MYSHNYFQCILFSLVGREKTETRLPLITRKYIIKFMTTLEDVLYLNYTTSSRLVPNDAILLPKYITSSAPSAEQSQPRRRQRKLKNKKTTHIKPGDECSICLEGIVTPANAYITGCGHVFHKTCLCRHVQVPTMQATCTMCRRGLELLYEPYYQRYAAASDNTADLSVSTAIDTSASAPEEKENYLDKLEDFWQGIHIICPDVCSYGYDHYLGMQQKRCHGCKWYCETGELL